MGGAYDFRVLRALRQKQNLTLEGLSRITGLSYPTIALIETNKTFPSLKTLDTLSVALKVSVSKLIALAEYNLVHTGRAVSVHPQVLKASGLNLEALCYAGFKGLKIFRGTIAAGQVVDSMKLHDDTGCNEIFYCLEGSIQIRIKEDIYRLDVNDVIVFNGSLNHDYTAVENAEYLVIHLPKDAAFMETLIRDKDEACLPPEESLV